MEIYKGVSVFSNVVIDRCVFWNQDVDLVIQKTVTNIEEEIEKFYCSQKRSLEELQKLYDDATYMMLENDAMIFKSHQMMIEDNDFIEKIKYYIRVFKCNAEYAIFKSAQDYIKIINSVNDGYISQRADDVKDIMKRLINNLNEDFSNKMNINVNEPCILFIKDLMPSEILSVDRKNLMGIVTQRGNKTSHTAILAKNMGIPMIVGVDASLEKFDGKKVILDGLTGKVIIDPTEEILQNYKEKQIFLNNEEQKLKSLIKLPCVTLDNKEIKIMANVTSSADVAQALNCGAQGVGLYRSEFLYMNRATMPSEQELFDEYKSTLMVANGREVIIRTLDVGSDKNVNFLSLPKETNPALGVRALRLCFEHLGLFKTQLKALLRASAYGNLRILLPMVISVSEIIKVKKIINEVKDELKCENINFDQDVKIGAMIETPSSVIISDLLAQHVDFFSIGTNDLLQYTLVFNRDDTSLSELYQPNNIAILRMIKMVVDNAHENNIWVEVCGEAAGDPKMTDKLIGLGVDGFSVDTPNLLQIKNTIRHVNYEAISDNLLKKITKNSFINN